MQLVFFFKFLIKIENLKLLLAQRISFSVQSITMAKWLNGFSKIREDQTRNGGWALMLL